MTAVALHQIGVWLFQLGLRLHDPATTEGLSIEAVTQWEPEQNPFTRLVPDPTLFIQPHFAASEQYPDGLADVAGYWAEDRILGGVVLFDKSQTWKSGNEPNMYFQCNRRRTTYRICQLLDEQQQTLLDFLQKRDANSADCPLPLLPDARNQVRIEPVDAISVHKVYRDVWERAAPRRRLRMQQYMGPDVINSLDFPEHDVDEEIRRLTRR